MKKLLIFALVFVLLISGCEKEPEKIVPEVPEISEVPEAEVSESLTEEELVEEVPEEPETTDEWEKFLREMNENGISENDIGVLENAGFEQEERLLPENEDSLPIRNFLLMNPQENLAVRFHLPS